MKISKPCEQTFQLASNRCFDPCLFWDISCVDNSSLNFQILWCKSLDRQTNMSLTNHRCEIFVQVHIFFKEAPERLENWHPGCGSTQGSQKYSFPINARIIDANAPGPRFLRKRVSASSVRRSSGSAEFECCFQHLGNHQLLIPNKNWGDF